jgi:hypothetical protein
MDVKYCMLLPQRVNMELVFLPSRMRRGGLLPLAVMTDVLTIVHAYRMLLLKDEDMNELA